MKWVQFHWHPFTLKFHNTTLHPPYNCSISYPTDHLKRTNSNSSTRKIRLKIVTNSQAAAHKSWVGRCSPSNPGFSCNNFHNFHGFNHSHSECSYLKDFYFLLHFQVFDPSNKLLKIVLHISLQLWIHATKVLPRNPYLRLERSVFLKNFQKIFLMSLLLLRRSFQGVLSCFEIFVGSA